ncbi:hypothetical protein [Actinosynnema sp. NPDC020468]|uniref:hypothetical protein n=1 Tax=Actinosynnema sp. NPDC020468 TaxID=3154488 RepID=UPI0033CADFAB
MTATMRLVLLGVVATIQPGLSLVPLLRYDHAPAAGIAFGVFALVTAGCAPWVARRRPLPGWVEACGAVAVLGASVAANAALPADGFFGPAHWSFGLVGWHLLLLLTERSGPLVGALGLHVVVSIAQFLSAGAPDRADVGRAGVVVLSVTSFQLGMFVIIRVLRRGARQAELAAAAQQRAETRVALARQWEQDLRTGFAGQLGATLPLLADLADGVLDPRDEETRRRCALAATQLRRLFAENDDVPDPLVHEVAACVDVAERRGVAVSLAVGGAPVPVPKDVRRALTTPLATALSAAHGKARVSLLRTPDEVRVAVVATGGPTTATPPDPSNGVEPAGGRAVAVETDTYGGRTRTEARWRVR